MRLELRNKKMNAGVQPNNQFMNFRFKYTVDRTTVDVDMLSPASLKSTAERVREVLARAKGPMAQPAIAKAIKDSTGVTVKPDTLLKTLNRNFLRDESGSTLTWRLRE
jgi:hypothetical protein